MDAFFAIEIFRYNAADVLHFKNFDEDLKRIRLALGMLILKNAAVWNQGHLDIGVLLNQTEPFRTLIDMQVLTGGAKNSGQHATEKGEHCNSHQGP